ncbi:MAG: A/G-specific adenine glycosylase [Gammaproteobacteria bacterium]|nr:A/G-specific adenine glycosylase [Gammaproteobacteria bacterium]
MAVEPASGQRRIAGPLLAWARKHGRRDLPWQHPATAYRVWVSEVMLQQTRVATVIPYFMSFTARFPTLPRLAEAKFEDVLAQWSGLGYYARARNLHAAARLCVEQHRGKLPESPSELAALPGIGRSTAGAILALACNRHAAILDGNAKRVLARYHAVRGRPGKREVEKALWQIAEKETPRENFAAYTQAIMDLGATICTRSAPDCESCPLASGCTAHALGRETHFPAPRPKRARPVRERSYAWIERDGEILFEQRAPQGIWGGLLCLPELPDSDTPEDWCRNRLGLIPLESRELEGFEHGFTHFQLHAHVMALDTEGETLNDTDRYRWLTPEKALQLGLPAPLRRYLSAQTRPPMACDKEMA